MSSIKPLDFLFLKVVDNNLKLGLLEEHGFMGGLGIRINNWLFRNDNLKKINTINFNTPGEFINKLGSQNFLRKN